MVDRRLDRELIRLTSGALISMGAVAFTLCLSASEASAQVTTATALQSAMQDETRARESNTARDWCSAGAVWLSQGAVITTISSHQDWVKDRQDPSKRPLSIAIHKRAIACYLKAYELEGVHDSAFSRGRSMALHGLKNVYQSLIRVDPQNGDWHYLLGEALCSEGWYKVGNAELSRAKSLGGAGGSKATALAAHVQPFVQRETALEQKLANTNAKINEENGRAYAEYEKTHPHSHIIWNGQMQHALEQAQQRP